MTDTAARSGATFGQWVLKSRPQSRRRGLDDPCQANFTIWQIAFGWGFNKLSCFSRALKAKFGVSPAQYRRRMAACPPMR